MDRKTYTFDEAFKASLDYFTGDELAAKVWVNKYALKDAFGNIYEESPNDMHHRLASEIARVEKVNIGANKKVQALLEEYESTPLNTGTSLAELIRRPELNYEVLAPIDEDRPELPDEVAEQVNINIKYDGYIKRQIKQVENFKKLEVKKIQEDFDYDDVNSLRIEARQKLKQYQPVNIGQASRISGVSPADISVLLVYMEQMRQKNSKKESYEKRNVVFKRFCCKDGN